MACDQNLAFMDKNPEEDKWAKFESGDRKDTDFFLKLL
jgi:hypothetical protein